MRPGDENTASTASNPPQAADATCPGRAAPHAVRPKRGATTPSKLAVAAQTKRAKGNLPGIPAASPAETADATPPEAAGEDAAEGDRTEVQFGGVCLVAPKTWTRDRPPVNFILAEFSLPRAQGDESDAQLTVAAAGGNNPRGLDRLRQHLKQQLEAGSAEHLQIGGNEVVLAESSGDYGDTSDPFPSPVSEGRYRVLNAVVFVGDKAYLVNCTGPEKTVGERAGEFRAFLQTMKSVD
jgi:hypothetical protein